MTTTLGISVWMALASLGNRLSTASCRSTEGRNKSRSLCAPRGSGLAAQPGEDDYASLAMPEFYRTGQRAVVPIQTPCRLGRGDRARARREVLGRRRAVGDICFNWRSAGLSCNTFEGVGHAWRGSDRRFSAKHGGVDHPAMQAFARKCRGPAPRRRRGGAGALQARSGDEAFTLGGRQEVGRWGGPSASAIGSAAGDRPHHERRKPGPARRSSRAGPERRGLPSVKATCGLAAPALTRGAVAARNPPPVREARRPSGRFSFALHGSRDR